MSRNRKRYPYDAFISHADDCGSWVARFISNLKSLGLEVRARAHVSYGEDSDEWATKAIGESAAFIQIVSPGAPCSQEARRDLERAAGLTFPRGRNSALKRKLVRVLVSAYDYPSERLPAGLKPIKLVSYNTEEYEQTVIQLAKDIVGMPIDKPNWKVPDPCLWPVEANIWNRGLDIMEFLVKFAVFWSKSDRSRSRVRLRANSDLVRLARRVLEKQAVKLDGVDPMHLRGAVYRYLYEECCHSSVEILADVLDDFREYFNAASKLVSFDGRADEWRRDAYVQIDHAVLIEKAERERDEDANEKARRESVTTSLWDKSTDLSTEEIAELVPKEENGLMDTTTPTTVQWNFFLAHAGPDKATAEELYSLLSGDHEVFLDTKTLLLGADWDVEIARAQRASRVTVVLISDRVEKAYYQREEIAAAIALARADGDAHRVVPVYLDGWPSEQGGVPYGLQLKHGLDAKRVGGMSGVATSLRELLSRLAGAPPPPKAAPASSPPAVAVYDRTEIADILSRLLDPQFEEVIFQLNVTEAHLPARSEALATRAKAIIRLMEQEGNDGLGRLADIVRKVAPNIQWRSMHLHAGAPAAHPVPVVAPVPTTGSAPVGATLTWDGVACASSTYRVNSFDDVVLCMHPDAEREWREVVPSARSAGLPCITIQTPGDAWHRGVLDEAAWKNVFEEIKVKVQEARAAKPKRIHLLLKAPFSLGAFLGARLDPQNHGLVVYQHDNKEGSKDEKVWRPWGPAWPTDPGTRSTPFFDLPPELGQRRPEEDGDIAIIVNITGRGEAKPCVEAVRAHKIHRPVRSLMLNAREPGQGAIRVPADADKAANELEHLIQEIAETLPNATLHLFYYGPLAVLVRASRSLWLRRPPIIVYEAIYPDGKPHWLPAVAFPEGKLLIGDGAP